MEQLQVELTSIAPLMMHSNRGLNPFDPLTRDLKKLTGKRKKSDDDLLQIMDIEFQLGLYCNGAGPFIPAQNVEATLLNSGKMVKRGPDVKRGISVLEDEILLKYDGPKDISALLADHRFRDIRAVGVSGRGIIRCRPIFHEWAAAATILYNEEIWNESDVVELVDRAGQLVGFCEMRPRMGRFSVESKS